MILKTYGIENLVDWKAQINVGKAKVIVHFTGGAVTRYGVTPAEYSTSDPMMQHIIEKSDYYQSGRIKLLRAADVADDAATRARKARETKREMQKVAEDAVVEEIATESPTLPTDNAEPGSAEESKGDAGLKEVKITCLQDAMDYLKENFNVPSTSIRSYDKAQAAAAEHGVVFVGGRL